MKTLKEICPDAAAIVEMDLKKLSQAVLHCVHSSGEPLKRKEIARTMADAYHPDFQHSVSHAVEQALEWLCEQCFLGVTPYDQDLIYVTSLGQDKLKDGEHPEVPADIL